MTFKGLRAWIGDDEELQICHYSLEFRDMKRSKLAEKIQAEVRWPGKPPEIEVLERKISYYRKHAIDYPVDKPWSMATLDKYPIPPEAIPAVLACWRQLVQCDNILTIREAKWVSRLYALVAEEIRQNFTWRYGVKWLEPETSSNNATGRESSLRQFSRGNEKNASKFSLQAGKNEYGTIECPKCRTPIGIGPTSRTAVCVGCEAQFDIVRIPAETNKSGAVCKETSIVKNIPPVIQDISNLIRYAKGYAHLELIYDLIGKPFDSTYMDKIMMGLGEVIPDFNEESWLLPYVALGIRDFKQFKDQIGRLINERSHRKKG